MREITHSYTVTGSNNLQHWMLCSVCEAPDESTKELHEFGEWTVTGSMRSRSCVCGYTESEKVPVDAPETTAPESEDTTADPEGDVTTEAVDDVTTEPVTEPETDPATEPETDPETEPSDNETEEPKKDGCGSVISGTAALVALALILPTAVAVKKKGDEE